jgi:predicted phage tail protein
MLINFYGELSRYPAIDLQVDNIKLVLAGLKHNYGQALADKLIENHYYYILADSKNPEHFEALHPDLITMNFGDFDRLMIIPDIAGAAGGAIVAAIAGAVYAATTAGIIIATVINIAISIALSMLMNMLSPTPEFTSDPAAAQKLDSALYNGAPNIREQGGSVPLIYGDCHCGGVLISAGLSTEEKTV